MEWEDEILPDHQKKLLTEGGGGLKTDLVTFIFCSDVPKSTTFCMR
jgi:hypothetical protein